MKCKPICHTDYMYSWFACYMYNKVLILYMFLTNSELTVKYNIHFLHIHTHVQQNKNVIYVHVHVQIYVFNCALYLQMY